MGTIFSENDRRELSTASHRVVVTISFGQSPSFPRLSVRMLVHN